MAPLDWAQPWFVPWRDPGEQAAARIAAGTSAHEALNAAAAAPVTFVAQDAMPPGTPYERFIHDARQVPTRAGLHDFFNGLVWIAFPRTKGALNRLQSEAIRADGVAGRRGPVRDAITVFDENGALLSAPPPLWEALLARDWRRLFVELRPLWGEARLLVFGHALLEKLAVPRKDMTAHVWAENAPLGGFAELDAWLGGRIAAERIARKPFTPLPVLGVPGWAAGNADESFYDDPLVFRPRRP